MTATLASRHRGTSPTPGESWGRGRVDPASVAPVPLAAALWALTLVAVRPSQMNDVGLVSVLPWTGFLALAVLALGFARALAVGAQPAWVLLAYPIAFTGLVFVTPAVLYNGPRYSWAWKHLGIVDYIDRMGAVDPNIEFLSVYHNWPGFFAANAMLTRLLGLEAASSYAAWAELFFNVLTLLAAVAVLRTLSDDDSTVAVGAWLFSLGNWVGQGYFSPQALNFFWYLLAIAILLRWFPRRVQDVHPDSPLTASPSQQAGKMAVLLALLVCMVSTHQLTPVVALLTVGALTLLRRTNTKTLPLLIAALLATWVFVVAAPYAHDAVRESLGDIGAIDANLDNTLIQYTAVSDGQRIVSLGSRVLTLGIALLAAAGLVNAVRRGHRPFTAMILAGAPVVLVALSPYGHEILFRVYLFALVGFVSLGSWLLWPPATAASWRRAVVVGGLSLLLMGTFLLAQFGNDRRYHFTSQEIAASDYVAQVAPPNSLLIEGSRNYPSQFKNYEKFNYVPMSEEPAAGRESLVARPAAELAEWMSDDRFAGAYVIITRSQIAQAEAMGEFPGSGLSGIREALIASPAFEAVFLTPDAAVFTLAEDTQTGEVP